MTKESEWAPYEKRYADMLQFASEPCKVLVDAACGMGQILFVARKDEDRSWTRTIGLELCDAYVKNLREENIEAHKFDIDRDDYTTFVQPGSVDFVSFFEAFEHVERPLGALAKLLQMLRPGGRIYFSAQRYGKDTDLAIRPGEPIYIGPKLLQLFDKLLPCRLIDARATGARYLITLERTTDPVTPEQLMRGATGEATEHATSVEEPISKSSDTTPAIESRDYRRLIEENAELKRQRDALKEAIRVIAVRD